MKSFLHPDWANLLAAARLNDFEALWRLSLPLINEVNTGRGKNGWSKVGLLTLETPEGTRRLVVKRQVDYTSRVPRHPFRGIPTVEKEFRNIRRYQAAGVPTITPVYFEERRASDGLQAILVTAYLENAHSLDDLIKRWNQEGWPSRQWLSALVTAVARVVRTLHDAGYQNHCLYPRHIFIKENDGRFDIRLIDLEKTRWWPLGDRRRIMDLETLHRRTPDISAAQRLRFMLAYQDIPHVDPSLRRLIGCILRRHKQRGRRPRTALK